MNLLYILHKEYIIQGKRRRAEGQGCVCTMCIHPFGKFVEGYEIPLYNPKYLLTWIYAPMIRPPKTDMGSEKKTHPPVIGWRI